MKVGLLSPHYAYNYGAVLQAYALKTYLRENGVDAVILNRRPKYQCAIPSLKGRIARKLEEISKNGSFGRFEKEFLQPQTDLIVYDEDWGRVNLSSFDALIVGSDQVWRDDYAFNSFGFNLFLDFADGYALKRIAYAPSLGKPTWSAPKQVAEHVRALLKKFDCVSVREESSIAIMKNQFGINATLVLDPTFLLSEQDYRGKFNIGFEQNPYIATYILDYDKIIEEKLQRLSNELSMPIKSINAERKSSRVQAFFNRFLLMPKVTDWVKNIANAKYVITNSFHGMVFSIIFRKQFVVIMNQERGSARFISLLGMFGLENRLVTKNDELLGTLENHIDYNLIATHISRWREISISYIRGALGL